jgi:ubiquinone biosynthesis protein UbiJ
VDIQGDTDTGEQFQDILSAVDWDWEEQLSRITGDVLAHQAGKLARKATLFIKNSRSTLQQDISEYLQEEVRLLPARIEVGYFLEEVDQLRADVDRLSARVDRLSRTPDSNA